MMRRGFIMKQAPLGVRRIRSAGKGQKVWVVGPRREAAGDAIDEAMGGAIRRSDLALGAVTWLTCKCVGSPFELLGKEL